VRDIFPVEFVDSSIAYEGVVIDGVEPGARLVVQLSEPAGRFLRYPTGSELAEVVGRISSLRNRSPGHLDAARVAEPAVDPGGTEN